MKGGTDTMFLKKDLKKFLDFIGVSVTWKSSKYLNAKRQKKHVVVKHPHISQFREKIQGLVELYKLSEEYVKTPIIQATFSIPLIYSLLKSVVNRVISILPNNNRLMNIHKNRIFIQQKTEEDQIDKIPNQYKHKDTYLKPDIIRVIYAVFIYSIEKMKTFLKYHNFILKFWDKH